MTIGVHDKDGGIEDERGVVTWATQHKVVLGVGYRRCGCGAKTPRPTHDDMQEFVESNPGDNFIWAMSDWACPGWGEIQFGGETSILCPDCLEAALSAIESLRNTP